MIQKRNNRCSNSHRHTGIRNVGRKFPHNHLRYICDFNLCFILICATIFYSFFIYRTKFTVNGETYFTLIDDAMISMRYGRNLAAGSGFVWNPEEKPVEGFTNLGWTSYMALIHKLPIPSSKISLVVMITGIFTLLGLVIVVYNLTKIIDSKSHYAPLISAAVTAFYFPLVFWSLRGMEVGCITFSIYLVLILIMPEQIHNKGQEILICILILFSINVRIDVVLQLFTILCFSLYNVIKGKQNPHIPLMLIYPFVVGIVFVLLFQYLYFGSFLPNTYYLKVGGVSSIERMTVGSQVFYKYALKDFILICLIIAVGLKYIKEFRNKNVILCFYYSRFNVFIPSLSEEIIQNHLMPHK